MKKCVVILVISLLMFSMSLTSKENIRVGVYDSRAVAILYYQGSEFRTEIKSMHKQLKEAKEKKDSATIKMLEEKGSLMQKIAHDKGFGRGSVIEIIEKYENFKEMAKLLAEKENLSLILSKWELNYSADNVLTVDITEQLLKALGASQKLLKMIDQMKDKPPIKDAFFLKD